MKKVTLEEIEMSTLSTVHRYWFVNAFLNWVLLYNNIFITY